MRASDEINMAFTGARGLLRLMVVNIAVFLLMAVGKLFLFLAGTGNMPVSRIISWIGLPADPSVLISQPWSVITYMFVHENLLHILFNMLSLFWFGKIFCEFLSSRKVVVVYFLGGLMGALFYLIAFQLFPVFEASRGATLLIGASAGVIAVVVAIATLLPNYTMHLLFFGAVRLKYIAIVLVLLYLISIPNGNAGGHLAHLGGAFFGFLYTKLYRAGTDTGLWLEKFFSLITGLFDGKRQIKVVHRGRPVAGETARSGQPRQEVIDAILDKISRSGYSSLTEKEREILFKASKGKNL